MATNTAFALIIDVFMKVVAIYSSPYFLQSPMLPHYNGKEDGLNLLYKYFPNRIMTKTKLIISKQMKTSTNPVNTVAIYQIKHFSNTKL